MMVQLARVLVQCVDVMPRYLLVAITACALAGCAGDRRPPPTVGARPRPAAAQNGDVELSAQLPRSAAIDRADICLRDEMVTGSHIARWICRDNLLGAHDR